MLVRVAPLLAILGILFVSLCFGCGTLGLEETDVPHTENYSIAQATAVTVLNGDLNGDIRVEAWGKDYVELTWTRSTTWGKAELDKADVKVTQAPGTLEIEGTSSAETPGFPWTTISSSQERPAGRSDLR